MMAPLTMAGIQASSTMTSSHRACSGSAMPRRAMTHQAGQTLRPEGSQWVYPRS